MDAQQMMDAVMQGVARYQAWKEDFLRQWSEAQDKAQMRTLFASFPPDMKEALKSADPEAYQQLVDLLR